MSAQPDAHWPLGEKVEQISAGAREMPMQGIVGISVLIVSGVGLPQAGFTDPSGSARVLRITPVAHDLRGRAHDPGDALLLVSPGRIGQLGERDLSGHILAVVVGKMSRADVDEFARQALR